MTFFMGSARFRCATLLSMTFFKSQNHKDRKQIIGLPGGGGGRKAFITGHFWVVEMFYILNFCDNYMTAYICQDS